MIKTQVDVTFNISFEKVFSMQIINYISNLQASLISNQSENNTNNSDLHGVFRAVEFWRDTALYKHFKAWKKHREGQQAKAHKIYRQYMLQTGIKGLQFAVQVNNQSRSYQRKRVDSRHMAKYWLRVSQSMQWYQSFYCCKYNF